MNEQDIPIDIHVNKLQDWLVSRRIVDKNWHRHVKDVRNNINEALKDMPANEQLIKLLSGSCKMRFLIELRCSHHTIFQTSTTSTAKRLLTS